MKIKNKGLRTYDRLSVLYRSRRFLRLASRRAFSVLVCSETISMRRISPAWSWSDVVPVLFFRWTMKWWARASKKPNYTSLFCDSNEIRILAWFFPFPPLSPPLKYYILGWFFAITLVWKSSIFYTIFPRMEISCQHLEIFLSSLGKKGNHSEEHRGFAWSRGKELLFGGP